MFNCGRQLRIVAALPQEGKLTQGPSHVLIILVIYQDFQRTQQILTSLRPLLSLLRRYAQVVVGLGLVVVVIVLDEELWRYCAACSNWRCSCATMPNW